MKGRLHYLDAVRGIAALSVVFYHYMLDLTAAGSINGFENEIGYFFRETLDLGKFGVGLFFLISGFIIPAGLRETTPGIYRFCLNRFFRLYPLYWFAVIVGIFLPWPVLMQGVSFKTFAINFSMFQGYLGQPDIVRPSWTLQIELTFYMLCVGLAAMRILSSVRVCALISVGFLLAALLMACARNYLSVKLPLALPIALSLMLFGSVWRQAVLDQQEIAVKAIRWLLPFLVFMIVPISVVGYNRDFGYHEHWPTYVIAYLLAIGLFLLLTTKLKVSWRPLTWLGEISYSVYLLHTLIISAAFQLGLRSDKFDDAPIVFVLLMTVLTVFCAWLTYSLIELPFVRLGHKIGRQSSRLPNIPKTSPTF